MKNTMNILYVLVALFLVNFALANISVTSVSYPSVVNNTQGYFNITIVVNNSDLAQANISFVGSSVSGLSSSFANLSEVLVDNGTTSTIVKRVNFDSSQVGTVSGTVRVSNGSVSVSNHSFSVTVQSTNTTPSGVPESKICKYGINGTDVLEVTDISDKSGLKNDWEWKPLDDISVRIDFQNDGEKDNEDYTVKLFFFDDNKKDVSGSIVDDTDNLEQDVDNIDAGHTGKATFDFKISGDIKSGDYTLVAKVFKRGKEKEQCVYEESSDLISINRDSDQVIVKNVDGLTTSQCSGTVDLTAAVANIGENDEDRVLVLASNKELGINLSQEIDNLNSGDQENAYFSFTVPATAQEKLYKIIFSTEYDYNSNSDYYRASSDSTDDYTLSFSVLGNCITNVATRPTINAQLTSTAQVGKDMTIDLSVQNNANVSSSFVVAVDGYSSWASLVSVTPQALNLNKQSTGSSTITLKPTKEGQQTFMIKIAYNGQEIDQPVTVTVSQSSGFLSKAFGTLGKPATYLIVGIIILVAIIVLILIVKAIVSASSRNN